MAEQADVIELWHKRKQQFLKEVAPYIRYMAQSGFPAFLALIGIVCIIQYVGLIKNVPPHLPIAWIGAIVLTPFLCYSPLRTYLKEPDLIFLMPAEHRLSPYMRLSSKRSFRNSLLLFFAVLLVFWPLYRQSDGYIGLWLVVVMLLLKPINSYFAWQERRLSWNNQRMLLRLLRWLLMFVLVLAWLMNASLLVEAVLTLAVLGLLYVVYRQMRKFDFPWQRLIIEEKAMLRRLFSFFNWFIDVQSEAPAVRPRNYLAWLIRAVPYRQSATFIYLHLITFVRTEIGGICIRLLLLGGLVNYLLAANRGMDGWGVVLSYVLFGLLLSLQTGTLRKVHRYAIWKDIFPLQVQLQQQQTITIDRLLNIVLLALLFLPTFPIWQGYGAQLLTMLVFFMIYPFVCSKRLAAVMKKEEDE